MYEEVTPATSTSHQSTCSGRYSPTTVTRKIYIHPLVVNVIQKLCALVRFVQDICGAMLTVSIVTEQTRLRLSLIIMATHSLQEAFNQLLPEGEEFGSIKASAANETTPPGVATVWICFVPLVFAIPAVMVVSLPYWWRPYQRGEETMVMVTALFSLFVLEGLLPVLIFVSSVLLLLQQVPWLTGIVVLLSLWVISTFLTNFVRCAIYHQLGGH
jgi:hypothetical protein